MCSDEAFSCFTAVAPAASSASRVAAPSASARDKKRGPVTGVNGTRGLQLRIIIAAGALQRIRPGVIEDIFALAEWFFR